MKTTPETCCHLCGQPCEPTDAGRHISCEQEENARIAAWEAAIVAEQAAPVSDNSNASKAA